MAEVNATVLLAGLREYHKSLEKHLRTLEEEYRQVERYWRRFDSVYDGNAAREFRQNWQQTAAAFSEYQNRGQAIKRILEERIAALERLDAGR